MLTFPAGFRLTIRNVNRDGYAYFDDNLESFRLTIRNVNLDKLSINKCHMKVLD